MNSSRTPKQVLRRGEERGLHAAETCAWRESWKRIGSVVALGGVNAALRARAQPR